MINKKIIEQAEERITAIKAEANERIISVQQSILNEIESDFTYVGWNNWSHNQHIAHGQYERLVRAINDTKIKLLSVNYAEKSGIVKGSSSYNVSANGCTCADFAMRQLPCKHMYFFLSALKNHDYFQSIPNTELFAVQGTPDTSTTDDITHKVFVVAGNFDTIDREGVCELIYKIGGIVSSSVSKKTDYVIVGSDAELKLKKAQEYGITILTEKDFLAMINTPKDKH